MPEIKRTYLIGYLCKVGGGRFFHERDTDDAPTREQIESMEAKLAADNGVTCAITSISLIQNTKVQP
ncbi:hypothetical protein [Pseudomonas asiatica]|uniref:Uncharacterized protein n=1 Tax=Pseudomonas asiatica TaxID=2219225 RepID=A0ABU5L4D0_9PSED|nr:hypothetical protein [Pseudomonas asiatica]MDZ5740990.1 hypothetical protein [Pseudomonas asiatica]MDZ5746311.1 hypothetical protein [Pseudomonas asiatica]MDZ5751244.1 hypothetical protein [Pseudomonas asiatica]MDZ5756288.1 hypothetical protein [Pseudomonas asiatica]